MNRNVSIWLFGMLTSALVIVCPMQSSTADDSSATLNSLDWILGTWDSGGGSGERWVRISDNTFEGFGFHVKGSDTTITETLRLLQMGTQIFYLAKVSHNEFPVPFELIEQSEKGAVFENSTHDFPQRIVYKLTGDVLDVRIEGESDGKPRTVQFPFTKASE